MEFFSCLFVLFLPFTVNALKYDDLYKKYQDFKAKSGREISYFEECILVKTHLAFVHKNSSRYAELFTRFTDCESRLVSDYEFMRSKARERDSLLSIKCFYRDVRDVSGNYIYCDRRCDVAKNYKAVPYEFFVPDISCATAWKSGSYMPRCHLPLECNDIVENVSIPSTDIYVCYGRRVPVNRFLPKYKSFAVQNFRIFCNNSVRFSIPKYILDAPETVKTMYSFSNGSYAYFQDKGYAEIFSQISFVDISLSKVSKFVYVCDDSFFRKYPNGFLEFNVFPTHRPCHAVDRGICYDAYRDFHRCPDDYDVSNSSSTIMWRMFRLYIWEGVPDLLRGRVPLESAEPTWYQNALRLVDVVFEKLIRLLFMPFQQMWDLMCECVGKIGDTIERVSDKWYELVLRGMHVPVDIIIEVFDKAYQKLYNDPNVKQFYIEINKVVVDYFINSTRSSNSTVSQEYGSILSWLFGGLVDIFKPIIKLFISFIDDILATIIRYLVLTVPFYKELLRDIINQVLPLVDLLVSLLEFLIRIIVLVLAAFDRHYLFSEYLLLYVILTIKFRSNSVALVFLFVLLIMFGLKRHHPSFLLSIINPEFLNSTFDIDKYETEIELRN